MTHKQIREHREVLNKHQSETKDTIKERYMNEDYTKYKRRVDHRFGKPQKKNQTEIQKIKSPYSQTKNTLEDHSSRLEQVEDRISELKDKIEIKEKNRRSLSQTTQEL
jgi:chromosome segregation ATPase